MLDGLYKISLCIPDLSKSGKISFMFCEYPKVEKIIKYLINKRLVFFIL